MNKKVYGYTESGEPIDDEMIEHFVEEAEQGYETGQLKERRRGRGRPPLGDEAKVVGSLRLDPALRKEAELRAIEEGVNVSELLRHALRRYLNESQESHNPQEQLDDDPHGHKQRRNELDTTERFDKWFVSEIDMGFASMMSDYSRWLTQFSRAFRDFTADFKRVVGNDMATMREVTEKTVEKAQVSSTIQILRVKAFIEESERFLSRWDEIFHSKTGKGR
jgi:hypothetical protein